MKNHDDKNKYNTIKGTIKSDNAEPKSRRGLKNVKNQKRNEEIESMIDLDNIK